MLPSFRQGRPALTLVLAMVGLAVAAPAASAAFELDTSRPKQVRLTSYGGILVESNCFQCTGGKVTVKQAGKGKQPTLGTGNFELNRSGSVVVQLSKKGRGLVAKAKKSLKITISAKAQGGEEKGSDSITRKALEALPQADACAVFTQAEVEQIIGRPVGPPSPGDPEIGKSSDQAICLWATTSFPLRTLAIGTSSGDFANPRYLFSDPGNFNDLETDVPGPWDFGRTFASSVKEDTSGELHVIRGEDALSIFGEEEQLQRMIQLAPVALGRYPGS